MFHFLGIMGVPGGSQVHREVIQSKLKAPYNNRRHGKWMLPIDRN